MKSEIIICNNLGIYYKETSFLKIPRLKPRKIKKWVLQDVCFTISEGDIVGIMGRNGAGKSTLAKTIAGIYRPDKGSIQINGKVTLLSLALGFNNELSGIDNIYISGMYQGMRRREIKSKIAEIVEFAELQEHVHKPLKHFSSGMKARLAFSIATCNQPEILIIDEALATGDNSFQEKSRQRLKEMMGAAKCVLLISHSLAFLKSTCNKGLLLNNGKLQSFDLLEKTIEEYVAAPIV